MRSRAARACSPAASAPPGPLFYPPTVLADVPDDAADHARGDLRAGRRDRRPSTPRTKSSPAPTTPSTASSPMSSPTTARRIYRLSRALEYGMVAVNRVKITGAPIPFGGVKQSGLGREGSRHGLEAFTDLKYVCLDSPERHGTRDHATTNQLTQRHSPPGTATTSSIPRPTWPSTRAAKRRPASSPAARASTSPTATATRCLDAFAGLYCVNVGYGRTGDRRCHRRAGEGARLLPRLCRPRHRGLDHASPR